MKEKKKIPLKSIFLWLIILVVISGTTYCIMQYSLVKDRLKKENQNILKINKPDYDNENSEKKDEGQKNTSQQTIEKSDDVKNAEVKKDQEKKVVENKKESLKETKSPIIKNSDNQSSITQPKENDVKSEIEQAIEIHRQSGDQVSYNDNGSLMTIDDCNYLGKKLLSEQETTYVYQYNCSFTNYQNTTIVGMIVYYEFNGVQQKDYYNDYKIKIRN